MNMGRAFAIAVAAIGLLSAMDAMIKAQAVSFGPPQIALLRYVFGSLVILASMAFVRPPWPALATIKANAWRALLAVGTAVLFFYALGHLPLAETLALSLLSPCITVGLGSLLLGEGVGRSIVVALAIGLAGVLAIVVPKFSGPTLSFSALAGTAAAFGASFTYSLSLVLLRTRATQDHPLTIVAVQSVGSAAILALALPLAPEGTWQPLATPDWFVFGLLGVLGAGGHLLLTKAYSMAPATRLASADYSALIFAAFFGIVFFSEIPTWTTLVGSGLIMASSVAATRT
jgi:S-adenosylmethionine uptake transporter